MGAPFISLQQLRFCDTDAFGPKAAALGLALVGLCGLTLLWATMPETRRAG